MAVQSNPPKLFVSAPHACSYYPENTATMLLVDPNYKLDQAFYSVLLQNGFRRSGDMVYRPNCRHCNACVSTKVPVNDFKPNRAQRRTLKRNQDIHTSVVSACFKLEHFNLFNRYQAWRHYGDIMDHKDETKYIESMVESKVDTVFIEFRQKHYRGKLLAVAVCDQVDDGLSAVYTFYDPDAMKRSIGTFAILKQMEYVKLMGLKWLYLGYWIKDHPKMAYKESFRPLFQFKNDEWRVYDRNSDQSELNKPRFRLKESE